MMAESAFVVSCITLDVQCKVYAYKEYQKRNQNQERHKYGSQSKECCCKYDCKGRDCGQNTDDRIDDSRDGTMLGLLLARE